MNTLQEFINLPEKERIDKGIEYTPTEIASQPRLWTENFENLKRHKDEILSFLNANVFSKPNSRISLTGAGSSAHVGLSTQNLLRKRWQLDVDTRPTTDVITHWDQIFLKKADIALVSFARSGNSPESVAAVNIAEEYFPKICHVIVTCNKNGELAGIARKKRNAQLVLLSDETNDKGLAMTASFTTMVVAAQFLANIRDLGEYEQTVKNLSTATSSLFDDYSSLLKDIADYDFDRAFFLGGGDLYGCAVESSLKLQEMTDGKVMCKADTFLGVRHGPEAVINGKTLVVYLLSSDQRTRRYELDLMREIEDKKIGMTKVAVCNKADTEIKKTVDYTIEFDKKGRLNIPDSCRPVMDVTVGQLLGLFKSLNLGLRPDSPSERGIINRIVKGVKIYNQ